MFGDSVPLSDVQGFSGRLIAPGNRPLRTPLVIDARALNHPQGLPICFSPSGFIQPL